jgi:hypothetical protein
VDILPNTQLADGADDNEIDDGINGFREPVGDNDIMMGDGYNKINTSNSSTALGGTHTNNLTLDESVEVPLLMDTTNNPRDIDGKELTYKEEKERNIAQTQ